MTYIYYGIDPVNSGGEYQANIGISLSDDEYNDYVLGCHLLGEDELPDDIYDIRGSIYEGNGLDIYARETDNGVEYFGIKNI